MPLVPQHPQRLKGEVRMPDRLIDEVDVAHLRGQVGKRRGLRGDIGRADARRPGRSADWEAARVSRRRSVNPAVASVIAPSSPTGPMPSTSAESPPPRSWRGVSRVEPRRAVLHHPEDLRERLLRDRQRLGQHRDLTQIGRHEVHVSLVVDDVLGHVAVGFLDAALGELAGVAVVLVAGTAGPAPGVGARAAHRWHHQISHSEALDGRADLRRPRPATRGRSPGGHPRAVVCRTRTSRSPCRCRRCRHRAGAT